ncbi:putative membrane protein [Bacillus pseudomycoides]|uniref:hypothetical protein n=1 Tax=Bacillus pseudomycoides TaxID=64104 RepID=UPI0004EDA874|nr:hypothetical protein [Bacillus pseudomycoides]AIK38191.1 putative membrane protein [Bacillus pseudomycoides]AJI18989.1 putative membrane protein [Bacillus pseudomycoides]PEO51682.1 hypothetical protein CN559_06050 [Bacillus pseudomycoides]PHC37355.1 hypothetical protein COF01_14185 [Bacillus pseudomycoides]
MDILKALIPTIVSILIAVPIMFLKFVHIEERELLFETKINQAKLNFNNNIIKYILLLLAFFLVPTTAFHSIDGLDLIKKYGTKNAFELVIYISLLIFFISLVVTSMVTEKWYHKTKLVRSLALVTLFSSLTFYCPIASSAIHNKTINALPVLIALPLFVTLIVLYVSYKTTPKKDNKPLCKIVTEDYIKELDLVHSHMLNDGRAVLYDKYRSKDEVFYVCDYSSKVYLEFISIQPEVEEN